MCFDITSDLQTYVVGGYSSSYNIMYQDGIHNQRAFASSLTETAVNWNKELYNPTSSARGPSSIISLTIDPSDNYIALVTSYFYLVLLYLIDGAYVLCYNWNNYYSYIPYAVPFSILFDDQYRLYLNVVISGYGDYLIQTNAYGYQVLQSYYGITYYTSQSALTLSDDYQFAYYSQVGGVTSIASAYWLIHKFDTASFTIQNNIAQSIGNSYSFYPFFSVQQLSVEGTELVTTMYYYDNFKTMAYFQILVTNLHLAYVTHKTIYQSSGTLQVNSYGILNYQSSSSSKIVTILIQTSALDDQAITYGSYVAYIDLMDSNALFYSRPIQYLQNLNVITQAIPLAYYDKYNLTFIFTGFSQYYNSSMTPYYTGFVMSNSEYACCLNDVYYSSDVFTVDKTYTWTPIYAIPAVLTPASVGLNYYYMDTLQTRDMLYQNLAFTTEKSCLTSTSLIGSFPTMNLIYLPVSIQNAQFQLENFAFTDQSCSTTAFYFYCLQVSDTSTYILYDTQNNMLKIMNAPSTEQTLTFELRVYFPEVNQYVTTSFSYQFTQTCNSLAFLSDVIAISVLIGSSNQTFNYQSYLNSQLDCYGVYYGLSASNGSEYFSIDQTTYDVTIGQSSAMPSGQVTLYIIGYPPSLADFSQYSQFSQSLLIYINYYTPSSNKGPPVFKSALVNQIKLDTTTTSYTLPTFKDPDGDLVMIILNSGMASNFTALKSTTIVFSPKAGSAGVYQITVTLQDNNVNPLSSEYQFNLTVLPSAYFSSSSSSSNDSSSNFTVGNITKTQSQNNTSVDIVLQINNQTQKPVRVESDKITAQIMSIANSGLVTIKFSEDLVNISNISLITNSTLQVNLSTYEQDSSLTLNKSFYWYPLSFQNETLTLQLIFSDPTSISIAVPFDKLKIIIMDNSYFQSSSSLLYIQYHYAMAKDVPKQISMSLAATIQSVGTASKTTMNIIMFSSLAVNLFLSASLQSLWGMINSLQLIVNIPLFSIQFPENAQMLFGFIKQVCQFNIIPTTTINDYLFRFDEAGEVAFNDNFNENGISTQNLLMNLQTQFYVLALVLLLPIILPTLRLLGLLHHRINKLYLWLCKKLLYGFIIRAILEGYIDYVLCSLINLSSLLFSESGDIISSVITIIVFSVLTVFPFFLALFMRINSAKLETQVFKDKYESLYENLEADNQFKLMSNFFYVTRRYLFCIMCIFVGSYAEFQILVMIIMSLLQAMYLSSARPYNTRRLNITEMFNEICVLAISYSLIFFTDYSEDPSFQFNMGWLVIVLTALIVTVNMGLMIASQVMLMKSNYKKVIAMYKIYIGILQRLFLKERSQIYSANLTTFEQKKAPIEQKPTKQRKINTNYGKSKKNSKKEESTFQTQQLPKTRNKKYKSHYSFSMKTTNDRAHLKRELEEIKQNELESISDSNMESDEIDEDQAARLKEWEQSKEEIEIIPHEISPVLQFERTQVQYPIGVSIIKNMQKLLQNTPTNQNQIVVIPSQTYEDYNNNINGRVYDNIYIDGFEAYAFDDKILEKTESDQSQNDATTDKIKLPDNNVPQRLKNNILLGFRKDL